MGSLVAPRPPRSPAFSPRGYSPSLPDRTQTWWQRCLLEEGILGPGHRLTGLGPAPVALGAAGPAVRWVREARPRSGSGCEGGGAESLLQ